MRPVEWYTSSSCVVWCIGARACVCGWNTYTLERLCGVPFADKPSFGGRIHIMHFTYEQQVLCNFCKRSVHSCVYTLHNDTEGCKASNLQRFQNKPPNFTAKFLLSAHNWEMYRNNVQSSQLPWPFYSPCPSCPHSRIYILVIQYGDCVHTIGIVDLLSRLPFSVDFRGKRYHPET